MTEINIIRLFDIFKFSYHGYIERILQIGDMTAIRKLHGKLYRRNYERGLLVSAIAKTYNCKNFLEFGTGRGFTTACVLEINPNICVTTIDNDHSQKARVFLNELKINTDNVNFINSSSKTIADKLTNNFDLVFIDGGHDYKTIKSDFRIAAQKCINGIIVFDDFRKKHLEVRKFIKNLSLKKYLINSDGWIFKNELIHLAGDADCVKDNHEVHSGQILIFIGLKFEY